MCRYDFCLHDTCGHTVVGAVVEYCEKAVAPATTFSGGLQRTSSLTNFHGTEMPSSLPLFPSGGFRKLLSGPGTQTAPASEQTALTTRRREEGIRGTDESSSLHDNDAVLHHITESSRNPDDHHVGTDGGRMTSYGSTTAASEPGLPPNLTDFDTIEAEIDAIRADVQHMRAEAESQQRLEEPRTPTQQRKAFSRVPISKIPGPAMSHLIVAKAAEMSETGVGIGMPNPLLGKDMSSSSAINRSYAGTGTGRIKASATAIINSPMSEDSASSYATCMTSAYYDAVEHFQAPLERDRTGFRFAQPTQAASRRVDEILRQETSPAKASPETTPGRSSRAKAPDLETEKRAAQRSQKRHSLPDGWMPSPEQANSAERGLQKKEQIFPGSDKTPKSAEQPSPGLTLRKKTSSYMSPTKATQNRSIATIDEDRASRKSLRVKAGALKVNTALANADSSTVSSIPSRCGNAGDDSAVSPKTQASFTRSKKELSSPLKNIASAKTSDRPSLVIKLPLPLPHVANTTVTPRNPDGNFLDPIGEKLGKEDLLRRDSTPVSASPRTDRGSILAPVLARLNRGTAGGNDSPGNLMRFAGEALLALIQPKPRDPDNEPISRLISGLRGQSSAEIGRALAEGQHNTFSVQSVNPTEANAPIDPSVDRHSLDPSEDQDILDQGPKQPARHDGPQDPAIILQRRKPSTSHDGPQDPAIVLHRKKPSISHDVLRDPAIVFKGGSLDSDIPTDTADQRKTSQARSLRATATYFVPPPTSDSALQADPSIHGGESSGDNMWLPKGLDLFHEDDHAEDGPGSMSGMGFLPDWSPEYSQRSLRGTWHGFKFVPWQDESTLTPAFEPQPTLSRHFDLIHGDNIFDTPDASPTMDNTSSALLDQQDQHNLARWEIMGKGRRRYHWTGGDGLEISFKGIGPDAEHDPNSPVLYRNYRENTKTLHMHAASYPRTQVLGSPLPPNAPKLMRDYAEKMALSQIPCNEHDWTGKHDLQTNIVPVPGLCGPCKQGDKILHRIGGGIDLAS
ncbi:hypothetical protein MBLNU13_g01219t1 [Cladosporium sp. NU13]